MSPRTGRPKSDNPKIKQIGVRFDKETLEKLDCLSEFYKESRAEILRRGVERLYTETKK